ncbi:MULTISPECIES: phage holin [Staphylococcus]|jgi:phi LC3 family holin|uniref:phage holin n=1 Tax=Staphylococcus TaxID=1279 RepID=UPI000D1D8531|nr:MULTISPECIES: phage holin [Staphylococcus]DAL42994.1 MAG TPA_asm: holin [Caudoviricetes sp.]MDO0996578.1 phage holin [Staphylococcus hominis]MDS3897116.1 phage holin [Staphylococcus hominis]PTK22542.1 holin [Staphylococcus hominis]PTK25112.1 holin [Staphylococcus hominis]
MKNFLGINWQIRMTHSVGIIQLIASAILPVLVYLGIDWQALTSWNAVGHAIMQVISNPVAIGTILVNMYFSVIDGTSTGLTDSPQARAYHRPNND